LGPLAVLTAIVFGSAVAISFGLCSVLIIFLILGAESEQIGAEIGRLPILCTGFLVLTAVSGAAMYSLMKTLSWRWKAQAIMWLALVILGLLVWLR
jgi:hypothetical protein